MMIAQFINAQDVMRGFVIDKDTHDPIIGATISDVTKRKPLTVTDGEGKFMIPKNNYPQQIRITYIGYKPLVAGHSRWFSSSPSPQVIAPSASYHG